MRQPTRSGKQNRKINFRQVFLIIKTKAITLKRVNFSNTSLILTLLTPDSGKISVLAKGARAERAKPSIEPAMDLLSLSDIVYYKKSGGALSLLTAGHVLEPFAGIRKEIPRWNAGFIILESAINAATEEEADIGLFSATLNAIGELSTDADPRVVIIRYFYDLLKTAGVSPSLDFCANTGKVIMDQKSFIWAPRLSSSFISSEAPMGEIIEAIDTKHLLEIQKIWKTTEPLNVVETTEESISIFGKLLMEQVSLYLGKRPKSFTLINWKP